MLRPAGQWVQKLCPDHLPSVVCLFYLLGFSPRALRQPACKHRQALAEPHPQARAELNACTYPFPAHCNVCILQGRNIGAAPRPSGIGTAPGHGLRPSPPNTQAKSRQATHPAQRASVATISCVVTFCGQRASHQWGAAFGGHTPAAAGGCCCVATVVSLRGGGVAVPRIRRRRFQPGPQRAPEKMLGAAGTSSCRPPCRCARALGGMTGFVARRTLSSRSGAAARQALGRRAKLTAGCRHRLPLQAGRRRSSRLPRRPRSSSSARAGPLAAAGTPRRVGKGHQGHDAGRE